jgi:hypothetical protein
MYKIFTEKFSEFGKKYGKNWNQFVKNSYKQIFYSTELEKNKEVKIK